MKSPSHQMQPVAREIITGDPLKGLTICQPWAWAMIYGPKRIENRPRRMLYRGWLLVHAGASREWLMRFYSNPDLVRLLPDLRESDLVFGAIIGAFRVVDSVPVSKVAGQPFAWGPWCHITEQPIAFRKPIPYRGSLGLFNVPRSIVAEAIDNIAFTKTEVGQ